MSNNSSESRNPDRKFMGRVIRELSQKRFQMADVFNQKRRELLQTLLIIREIVSGSLTYSEKSWKITNQIQRSEPTITTKL